MATYKCTSFGKGCYKGKSFVPTIWSARLLSNMYAAQILPSLTTREYEGEIKGKGDVVKIFGVGAVTVACYEPNIPIGCSNHGSVAYGTMSDNVMCIKVEKADYFGIKVEDIEVAQSKPSYLNELTKEAGIGMAKRTDSYLYAKMHAAAVLATANCWGAKGGTSGCTGYLDKPPTKMSCTNAATTWLWRCGDCVSYVYNNLVKFGVALDNQLAPAQGRFALVPAFLKQAFLVDDRFVNYANPGVASARDNATLGNIAGFEIITMPNSAFTIYDCQCTAAILCCEAIKHAIIGVKGSAAYVEVLSKVENVRLEGFFADGVRGLHLYGGGVIRPNWLMAVGAHDPNH